MEACSPLFGVAVFSKLLAYSLLGVFSIGVLTFGCIRNWHTLHCRGGFEC
jgi:hypothetical protein